MFILCSSVLKRRLVMPFFVLLLLSGCGSVSPVPNEGRKVAPPSLGTRVSFDLGGRIHVHSESGFTCTPNIFPLIPGALILPKVQPIYDQGTLQTVKNYVATAAQTFVGPVQKGNFDHTPQNSSYGHIETLPYPAFSANPNAFQLMAVGSCFEILHITNISNTPVQISQVSVQLTADTQTNTQHYNLIDACSLLSLAPGCLGSIGGYEDGYDAEFYLHPGKTNTIIPATSFTCQGCSHTGPILQPGGIVKVRLNYFTSNNLSFSLSLKPSFTLDWPGNQGTYATPQLQASLAFASASHFSCYTLQGQRFIEVSLDSTIHSTTYAFWCI